MKVDFYDVKLKKKVKADVTAKVKYANNRCAFKAEKDGRSLTKFVSQADFDKADVPVAKAPKAAAKKAAPAKKAPAKKK